MNITPTLLTDGYKIDHRRQLPKEITTIYNNFTPRKGRVAGINKVAVVGIQGYVRGTLANYWNMNFFERSLNAIREEFENEMTDYTLSSQMAKDIGVKHWEELHKLGHLPIVMKALPEGSLAPYKVPVLTMKNTHPDFAWFPQFIETDLSAMLWGQMTTATLAFEYFKTFTKWARRTGANTDFVPFQGHDFSYRGMFGREAAMLSGATHLMVGFKGTDNIPAIPWLRMYYDAKSTTDIIGCSIPATEHAVMCAGTSFYIKNNNGSWEKYGDAELEVFRRLITEVYPTGMVGIVSDTWNLWKVLTEYTVALKAEIMGRDGKLVFRPDSGNPVHILCGDIFSDDKAAQKGVVEILWDIFGGQLNDGGYRELDPHVGAIYGDSITLDRTEDICDKLAQKRFASTNWVGGIGSFSYQYVTRDTHGFAMKATHAATDEFSIDLFKDPITDDGTKKSAKGLIQVFNNRPDARPDELKYDGKDQITMIDQCTPEQEDAGLLVPVFKNGKILENVSLRTVRKRFLGQV